MLLFPLCLWLLTVLVEYQAVPVPGRCRLRGRLPALLQPLPVRVVAQVEAQQEPQGGSSVVAARLQVQVPRLAVQGVEAREAGAQSLQTMLDKTQCLAQVATVL